MNPNTEHPIFELMSDAKIALATEGTMRLGAYDCALKAGSLAHKLYGEDCVRERHRHRYEFNLKYKEEFEKAGMVFSGINPQSNLVEIVELPQLRWYVGTQFHPEFSSTVLHPHPLFMGFVQAAIKTKE